MHNDKRYIKSQFLWNRFQYEYVSLEQIITEPNIQSPHTYLR